MSPIKGISETRRLPRLGKIHLGVKKTKTVNGQTITFPSAVDYFVFPEDNPLGGDLVRIFGEKPKELRILIPVDEEERWASQYYRCYSRSRGLVCRGDGETAMCMVDTSTGALADRNSAEVVMREVPCPGRSCPDYEQQCREIMNLQFLLPEVPGLGVWQIDTSSINSIRNINSAAELVKRIYGRVSMIPLLLTIEPQEVQDAEGKRRTVNVLNLRTNLTLIQMLENIAKPPPQMLAAGVELPESDDEVPEMVIPQVQEEKVTVDAGQKPAAPGLKPERQGKPKDRLEEERFGEGKQAVPPSITKRDPETVCSLQDLYRACYEDFRMQPKDVVKQLGYSSPADTREKPADCYRQIAVVRQ